MQEATQRPLWYVEEAEEHELHLDLLIEPFRAVFDDDGFEVVNQHGFVTREHADLACSAVNSYDAHCAVAEAAQQFIDSLVNKVSLQEREAIKLGNILQDKLDALKGGA